MPRRAEITPRTLDPDPVYSSQLVSQLINKVMTRGKKSIAEQVVYDALAVVGERTGRPPLEVLEQAIKSVTPVLEVRSRRVGGANYQVPVEVPQRRPPAPPRPLVRGHAPAGGGTRRKRWGGGRGGERGGGWCLKKK